MSIRKLVAVELSVGFPVIGEEGEHVIARAKPEAIYSLAIGRGGRGVRTVALLVHRRSMTCGYAHRVPPGRLPFSELRLHPDGMHRSVETPYPPRPPPSPLQRRGSRRYRGEPAWSPLQVETLHATSVLNNLVTILYELITNH